MRVVISSALLLLPLLSAPRAEAASPCRECIRRTVQAEREALGRCYSDLTRRAGPDAEGKVVVRFAVERDGTTRELSLARNDLEDRRFGRCVVAVFARMVFDAPPAPMRIAYPLVFRARGEPGDGS